MSRHTFQGSSPSSPFGRSTRDIFPQPPNHNIRLAPPKDGRRANPQCKPHKCWFPNHTWTHTRTSSHRLCCTQSNAHQIPCSTHLLMGTGDRSLDPECTGCTGGSSIGILNPCLTCSLHLRRIHGKSLLLLRRTSPWDKYTNGRRGCQKSKARRRRCSDCTEIFLLWYNLSGRCTHSKSHLRGYTTRCLCKIDCIGMYQNMWSR